MADVPRINQQDPCQLSHDPIVVYDDLRIDDDGRPIAWLYHVECYACGQILQLQPVTNSLSAVARGAAGPAAAHWPMSGEPAEGGREPHNFHAGCPFPQYSHVF